MVKGVIMPISEREWKQLKKKEKLLKQTSKILNVQEKDLPKVISRFIKETEEKKKDIERLKRLI